MSIKNLIRSKTALSILLALFLIIITSQIAAADIIFVKHDATGANDGTSWANAFKDLSEAIDQADPGDEVWVAVGIYRPYHFPNGGSIRRERHFTLKNEVTVYGGFAGIEDPASFNLDDRDFESNETILSGYHRESFFSSYRVYHVFYHPEGTDLDETAVLDGFTISDGMADGNTGLHDAGGGMFNRYSSPKLTNLQIINNEARAGGGIANSSSNPAMTNLIISENQAVNGGGISNAGDSSPMISNVVISYNEATSGGGMSNHLSHPNITDVSIFNNVVTGDGGGVHNFHSNPVITNVVIYNNLASRDGGGIYNYISNHAMTNVTISNNMAEYRGGGNYNEESNPILQNITIAGNKSHEDLGWGIYNYKSSPVIKNSIFWANGGEGQEIYNDEDSSPTVTWSIVQGGYQYGASVFTDDPQLQSLADNGGSTVTNAIPRDSPAYAIPELAGWGGWNGTPDTDQRGARRAMTGLRAMGAYEDATLVQPGVLMLLLDDE